MNDLPLPIPVGPQSIRVFCGYRLSTLARDAFFTELGETFMPGTPFMLAPLGLAAYTATVLDLDPAAGMPDEVALIVYASVNAYTAARRNSLQGRMYTHSHAGVFDMGKSRGQFPGSDTAPDVLGPINRWSWYLFDAAVDWQIGSTRVIFLQGSPAGGNLQQTMVDATRAAKKNLSNGGVDQVIAVAGDNFAALWFHGSRSLSFDAVKLGLVPGGVIVARDLVAAPAPMPNGTDGVTITGPASFSFRFVRDLRFFL